MKTSGYLYIRNLFLFGVIAGMQLTACLTPCMAQQITSSNPCSVESQRALRNDSDALIKKIEWEANGQNIQNKEEREAYFSRAQEEVLDHRFHIVDRTLPYFETMNGIGIITGDRFSNKPRTYGSATLIGSCYVITNKHVISGLLRERGQILKPGESFYFSVGQKKECKNSDSFEAMNQIVTLIDYGPVSGKGDGIIVDDWAILKLRKPINSVNPVSHGSAYFMSDQMLVRGGFPYEKLEPTTDFSILFGQYVQNIKFSSGVGIASDKISRPGTSGGGLFYTKQINGIPNLYFAGIAVGMVDDHDLYSKDERVGITENADNTLENIHMAYIPVLNIKTAIKKSGRLSWAEIVKKDNLDSCD